MTLYAQDGLPIVLLEGFQELVTEVDCQVDEGRLVLKWGGKEAWEYARGVWGEVVKRDGGGKFLLVVWREGCGAGGQRQAYV